MYWFISVAFMPIKETGSASVTNSCSILTASRIISCTRASVSLFSSMEYSKQAKSQCSPSSREMSSLEKVKPGIKPRFFSQKIEQNEPEKKIPSTAANAIKRSGKFSELNHFSAH